MADKLLTEIIREHKFLPDNCEGVCGQCHKWSSKLWSIVLYSAGMDRKINVYACGKCVEKVSEAINDVQMNRV